MFGGFIVIEVCDANPASSAELFQLEEEFPGVSVLETGCMSHCELCARNPYVYVDGELVSADTVSDLLILVRSRIQAVSDSETEM